MKTGKTDMNILEREIYAPEAEVARGGNLSSCD